MTSFTWKIININSYPQVEDKTNVVSTVLWRCDATRVVDGVEHAAFIESGTLLRPYKTPPADKPKKTFQQPTFIPYDQLTEAQVLDWVWNTKPNSPASDVTVKQIVEADLNKKLDDQITPSTVSTQAPWA